MPDYSKIPTADLEALSKGDMGNVSTATLQYLSGGPEQPTQAAAVPSPSQYNILPDPGTLAAHVATGINRGVSNLVGLPVDAVSKLLSVFGLAGKEPILGSENIQKRLMPTPLKPQGFWENTAQATGEQIPGVAAATLTGGGSMGVQAAMNAARVAGGAGILGGAARTVAPESPILDIGAQIVGGIAGGLTTKLPKAAQEVERLVNKIIDYGVNKGIKPTIGPKNVQAPLRYQEASQGAIKDIVKNKADVTLTDIEGNPVKNDVPHNFPQMLQAVRQRLISNFRTYWDEVKAATGKDTDIPLDKVQQDLKEFISDKVNQTEAPDAVVYAIKRLEAYGGAGTYTPEQMEKALQSYTPLVGKIVRHVGNKQELGQDAVDAIVQKALRETMDGAMAAASGETYRAGKNTFAALKQIEADVVSRSRVSARQNPYGLIDFSDVYTLPKAIISLARGDIGGAAMGIGSKAMARYIKSANQPDTLIKNMFTQVDKLAPSLPGPQSKWIPESTGNLFTKALPPHVDPTMPVRGGSIVERPMTAREIFQARQQMREPSGLGRGEGSVTGERAEFYTTANERVRTALIEQARARQIRGGGEPIRPGVSTYIEQQTPLTGTPKANLETPTKIMVTPASVRQYLLDLAKKGGR